MAPTKLTQEQYNELLVAERLLHDQLTEFDKLDECNIGCQDMRETTEQYLKTITALKKNFAPNR